MNKPLLALAGIALLGTAGVAGIIVASPGGEEEAQQVDALTASPTTNASATASATATASPAITILPSSSPTPTPLPASDGFLRYIHPATAVTPAFSFAYPAEWFLSGGDAPDGLPGVTIILTAWDTRTAPGRGGIPSKSMKVDIYVDGDPGRAACAPPRDSSEPAELGGELGWTLTKPVETDSSVIARMLAAKHSGFEYCVVGYFADPPDPTIFDRIIESFRFAE